MNFLVKEEHFGAGNNKRETKIKVFKNIEQVRKNSFSILRKYISEASSIYHDFWDGNHQEILNNYNINLEHLENVIQSSNFNNTSERYHIQDIISEFFCKVIYEEIPEWKKMKNK